MGRSPYRSIPGDIRTYWRPVSQSNPATRATDPQQFYRSPALIAGEDHAERREHFVEGLVRERDTFRVAFLEGNLQVLRDNPLARVLQPPTSCSDGNVAVTAGNRRADPTESGASSTVCSR